MRTDGMVRIEATDSDLLVSYPQLSGYSQPFASGLEAIAFYDFEGYVNLTVARFVPLRVRPRICKAFTT
jgi:hypothetical protein